MAVKEEPQSQNIAYQLITPREIIRKLNYDRQHTCYKLRKRKPTNSVFPNAAITLTDTTYRQLTGQNMKNRENLQKVVLKQNLYRW